MRHGSSAWASVLGRWWAADGPPDAVAKFLGLMDAGASFRSIHDRWADTSTPHGRLILVVLGGLAEYERELILARTAEGMVRARERGVKFGRPRALSHFQRQEAVQRLRNGESQSDIARSYGVSAPTISRLRATSAV
jgi:DNA invertase Pin-like site-specific DNA recombinase